MVATISNKQREYLNEQMQKVSRSFSLVAPEVDAPLDNYLAVAYLICRVVDNIEDVKRPFSWQKERYAQFARLLEEPREATAVLAEWESFDWPGLSGDERRLMTCADGMLLWDIYDRLPSYARSSIRRWTLAMAEGMARTDDPAVQDFFVEREGVRLPASYADYNQYCFYVAGTVGRMISDLSTAFYAIDGETAAALARDSEACGRALQKTNIVKDFAADLQRGAAFLPDEWLREVDYSPLRLADAPAQWKKKVLLDVIAELDVSANYVLALPKKAVGLRKASLLMMLPAYETILQAAQRLPQIFTPQHAVKISRLTMGQCVLRARKIALDDTAISEYAAQMSAAVEQTLASQLLFAPQTI